jgi:hypothetical protein
VFQSINLLLSLDLLTNREGDKVDRRIQKWIAAHEPTRKDGAK